jgi:solute carrier family 6 GABA transporter-like protein 1
MACFGFAVGLGNLLRYPSVAWANHGLQWFIPYLLALFFIGIPLLMLEIAFGQGILLLLLMLKVYRSGNVTAFGRVNERFRGLGFATIVNAYIVATYYNVIVSWILIYFGNSFTNDLPYKEDARYPLCLIPLALISLKSLIMSGQRSPKVREESYGRRGVFVRLHG